MAQTPLSAEAYVEQVLARSLDARVAAAEGEVARAEAVGVGLWPNPAVEWERQPNPTETQVVGGQHVVAASIPLVLSGRLGLEAEGAARRAEAAGARLERARSTLRLEASRAFHEVLAAQARREALVKSRAALEELAGIIAARERAGEASGYDSMRMALELSVVDDALLAGAVAERRAKAEALRLLGPGVEQLPPLAGELGPERPLPEVAPLLAALETQRADVRALTLEAAAAESTHAAAARRWIPEPSVSAGALILEGAQPGAGVGYVVGATLPLPLFDRGQGERARTRAARELVEARRAQTLRAARAQLTSAVETLTSLRERLSRHRPNVLMRAEELRRTAQAAYRGGAVELLALVDAERAAREARLSDVDLRLALSHAEAELRFLSGAYDGAAPRSPTP